MKVMPLTLTPGEWRKLRFWAAEEDRSIEEIVDGVLRRELAGRPIRTY